MSKLVTKVLSFLKRANDKDILYKLKAPKCSVFLSFSWKPFGVNFFLQFIVLQKLRKLPGQLSTSKKNDKVFWFVCRCVLVVSATSCMDHYANTFRLRYATSPEKANGVILGENSAEHFLWEGSGKRAMKNDTIPQQLGLGHVSVKDWRDLSSAFPIPTAVQCSSHVHILPQN